MNLSGRVNFAIFVVGAAIGWVVPAPSIHAQTPPAGGYVAVPLGLTGPEYIGVDEQGAPSGFHLTAGVSNNGQVVGRSARFSPQGIYTGADAWRQVGGNATPLGLTGSIYEFIDPILGIVRSGTPTALNPSGHVAGYNSRLGSTGQNLGRDAWLFDGVTTHLIGLTGADYEYAANGGVYRLSSGDFLGDGGQVLGASNRVAGNGDSLGRDAWVFNGNETRRVGLIGGEYESIKPGGIMRSSSAIALNSLGLIAGGSQRYNAPGQVLGTDAWFYDGTGTSSIGLAGGIYERPFTGGGIIRDNTVLAMNEAGWVVGSAKRQRSSGGYVGSDLWFFDGNSTQRIGQVPDDPPPGGQPAYSENQLIDISDARVVGYHEVRGTGNQLLGYESWIFDGTSTDIIGLTGTGYEIPATGGTRRYVLVEDLNDAGHAIGTADRYNDNGTVGGQDAWFFNGTSSLRIGLTGQEYERTLNNGGTYRNSNVILMNNAGQVVGASDRYIDGSISEDDIWLFDPVTNETTPIETGLPQHVDLSPVLFTDEGAVFGYYRPDNHLDDSLVAFFWSIESGFHAVSELVINSNEAWVGTSRTPNLLPIHVSGQAEGGMPKYVLDLSPVSDAQQPYLLTASISRGDADLDGDVDLSDLGTLATYYGETSGVLWTQGDFDGDGDVDLSDLSVLAANYGAGEAQALADFAEIAAVPEPASTLLLLALPIWISRRRLPRR